MQQFDNIPSDRVFFVKPGDYHKLGIWRHIQNFGYICEQVLKRAVLHRKNALFYKTQTGADVSDLFMSIIHTCRLNGANPFDYLTALEKHEPEVTRQPEEWMPWNYSEQLRLLDSTIPAT